MKTQNSTSGSGIGGSGIGDSGDGRAVIARAFTLMEVLISVAAMALIAVGLATIFGAIGRTVTTGKSVSAFTSYAALIERQMRGDFENMTREFPLVIRNELAGDGPSIPLYAGDINPRPRRIDEIMFGAKGAFASSREPLYPGWTARGDAARIYYGHGQRRIEDLTPSSPYRYPTLDDANFDSSAGLGVNNNLNPNRYPSDWTLLRQVTVFAGPATTGEPPPLSDSVVYLDNEIQIGLQPAASSPFRRFAVILPNNNWPPAPPFNNLVRGLVRPQFSSGLVDVTSSDFAFVRAMVTSVVSVGPGAPPLNDEADIAAALAGGEYLIEPSAPYPDALGSAHHWMDELFPTWSMAKQVQDRVRMRYEPASPDYFAPLAGDPPYFDPTGIKSDWGRADQVMLSSSNFLPHCSEFIVEWSFGKVWTPLNPGTPGWDAQKSGTPIWHGLTRKVALDPKNPGILTTVAEPYNETKLFSGLRKLAFNQRYRKLDNTIGEYLIARQRIHGLMQAVPPVNTPPLTSYFGYVDPQFNPNDPNDDGNTSDASASSSIPWAWPELIRITISLADPNDPAVEQTFQFVFDAPGNPVR